jgi:acetyl esterase
MSRLDDRMDPEIRAFHDALQADWRRHPPLESLSPAEARAVAEIVRSRWAAGGPAMAATDDRIAETDDGPVRIRIHHPTPPGAGPSPALIYLHGGGFVMFSLDTHDRLMREYAARGGFAVIGVDYPLAPEARFPVALNRIASLLKWLRRHGPDLSIDPQRLAIGGDSAGGNLSFATCLKLRQDKAPLPAAMLCNYASFTSRCTDRAERELGGPDAILNRAEVEFYFDRYTGNLAALRHPLVSPLDNPTDDGIEVAGLPPVFLAVPELDILSEQSLAMHEKLRRAGIAAELRMYRGATHSFLEAMSVSAVARQAIADGADWLAARLNAA